MVTEPLLCAPGLGLACPHAGSELGARGDMSTSVVPNGPLPLPQHVRLALLADASERSVALESALQRTGRRIERHSLLEVVDRGAPLQADVVVVCAELEDVIGLAPRLIAALTGAVVVCSMPAEATSYERPSPDESADDSAVARVAAALPMARVVGGLQQFSADHFALLSVGLLETDAPITADDREAADLVEAILDGLPGVDAFFAGPLRNAPPIEAIAGHLRAAGQATGCPVGFRLDPRRGLVFRRGT